MKKRYVIRVKQQHIDFFEYYYYFIILAHIIMFVCAGLAENPGMLKITAASFGASSGAVKFMKTKLEKKIGQIIC